MRFFGDHVHSASALRVVVNVSSDLLQALVVEVSDSSKVPKAVKKFTWKLPSNFSPLKSVERLHGLLYTILRELHTVPASILIGIGPSLGQYSFQTLTLHPTVQKPVRAEDYFRDIPPSTFSQERCELIVPLSFYLNGYRLVEFESFLKQHPTLPSAQSISATFLGIVLTFAPDVCVELAGLEKSWGGMPIFFLPSSIALHSALEQVVSAEDGILIDIGGDDTSLLLFREKEIVACTTFPVGRRQFARAVSKEMNISLEEAEDMHEQHIQGIGADGREEQLEKILIDQGQNWYVAFLTALDAFYTSGPIPATLFLTGSGARISQLQKNLLGGDWLKKLSPLGVAGLRILNAEEVFQSESLQGNLCGPGDFALAALLRYQIAKKS